MYFATIDSFTGNVERLAMVPLEIQRFRLKHVSRMDAEWLQDTLTREGKQTATEVVLTTDNHLMLEWARS